MIENIPDFFSEMGNITAFLALSVTILGAVSRLVHQVNIADSAELWITLVGTLGFGLFVPFILLGVNIYWPILLLIVFCSFFLGRLASKSTSIRIISSSGPDITILVYAIFSLLSAFAYLHLHGVYYQRFIAQEPSGGGFFGTLLFVLSAAMLGIYVLLMTVMLLLSVSNRLFASKETVTTEIDGQMHLVAMRHNQYHWLLMPCTIKEGEKSLAKGKVTALYRYVVLIRHECLEYLIACRRINTFKTILRRIRTLKKFMTLIAP